MSVAVGLAWPGPALPVFANLSVASPASAHNRPGFSPMRARLLLVPHEGIQTNDAASFISLVPSVALHGIRVWMPLRGIPFSNIRTSFRTAYVLRTQLLHLPLQLYTVYREPLFRNLGLVDSDRNGGGMRPIPSDAVTFRHIPLEQRKERAPSGTAAVSVPVQHRRQDGRVFGGFFLMSLYRAL